MLRKKFSPEDFFYCTMHELWKTTNSCFVCQFCPGWEQNFSHVFSKQTITRAKMWHQSSMQELNPFVTKLKQKKKKVAGNTVGGKTKRPFTGSWTETNPNLESSSWTTWKKENLNGLSLFESNSKFWNPLKNLVEEKSIVCNKQV